jgi:FHS family glucose/mannose:H+ symporter-like MFS transporter
MIRNIKALTASCFVSMFFIGVGTTIIGAAARNIGLTPYQIGLLMAVQNIGFMISVVLSGALSDSLDKTKILFAGSAVLAIAFFVFYLWKYFSVNLAIMFFIGVGMGTYEGVTDAMLLDIHDRRESLFININHFFVTFGSLMITLYLLFLQMNWRKSSTQSGIVVSVLALFFLLARREPGGGGSETLGMRLRFLTRERAVGLLFAATICAVGIELGNVGIMTTYLMELRGFNQVTSKIALIVFLAGVASGRVLVGFFSRKQQIPYFILSLFGSASIFLSLYYFTDLGYYTYILVYFTGMTVSALLPLIITLAGLMYKEYAGTVLGIIKFGIPIGGIFIPFFFSLLSKYLSFRTALSLFPFVALLGFIIPLAGWRNFRPFIDQSTSEGVGIP